MPSAAVERITTHAAVVFLVGERAYKMKRAVRYSFLDFTTLDRRKRALESELELNRRTAPMLYRRLIPVTREAGGALALAGSGEPVEWLLEMVRFDQQARLDRVALRGELTPTIVDELAAELVAFHERAAVRAEYGGPCRDAGGDRGQCGRFRSAAARDPASRSAPAAHRPLPRGAGPATGAARGAATRGPRAPLPRRSAPRQYRPARGPPGAVRLSRVRRGTGDQPTRCTISPSCSWTCSTRASPRSPSAC